MPEQPPTNAIANDKCHNIASTNVTANDKCHNFASTNVTANDKCHNFDSTNVTANDKCHNFDSTNVTASDKCHNFVSTNVIANEKWHNFASTNVTANEKCHKITMIISDKCHKLPTQCQSVGCRIIYLVRDPQCLYLNYLRPCIFSYTDFSTISLRHILMYLLHNITVLQQTHQSVLCTWGLVCVYKRANK